MRSTMKCMVLAVCGAALVASLVAAAPADPNGGICNAGSFLDETTELCLLCKGDTFQPFDSRNVTSCDSCPDHANCDTLTEPLADPEYYDVSTDDTRFVFAQCQPVDACVGGNECSLGYEGTMCGGCADGYYRLSGECAGCPGDTFLPLLYFCLTIAGYMVIAALCIYAVRKSNNATFMTTLNFLQFVAMMALLSTSQWSTTTESVFSAISFFNFDTEPLAIPCLFSVSHYFMWYLRTSMPLFTFFCFLLVWGLRSFCKSKWPSAFRKVHVFISKRTTNRIGSCLDPTSESALNLLPEEGGANSTMVAAPGGVDHEMAEIPSVTKTRASTDGSSPLPGAVAPPSSGSISPAPRKLAPIKPIAPLSNSNSPGSTRPSTAQQGHGAGESMSERAAYFEYVKGGRARDLIFQGFLFYVYIAYVGIAKVISEHWDCTHVEDEVWLLDSNSSLECFKGAWDTHVPLAAILTFLSAICLPVAVWFLLFTKRALLRDPTTSAPYRILNRMGFLFMRYRHATWYWEIVIIVRKVAYLTSFVLLSGSVAGVLFAALAIALSLMLQVKLKPYARQEINKLEAGLLVIRLILLLVALIRSESDVESDGSVILDICVFVCLGVAGFLSLNAYRKETVSRKFNRISIQRANSPRPGSARAPMAIVPGSSNQLDVPEN